MTNNNAEYKDFLAGLRITKDMGARMIKICTDFQLVASQVTDESQVKEECLQEYVKLIQAKMKEFEFVEVVHVPREHNA